MRSFALWLSASLAPPPWKKGALTMTGKNSSFGGFAAFARCLAHEGLGLLDDNRGRGIILGRGIHSKRLLLVLPEVVEDILEVTVLSGLRDSALPVSRIASGLDAIEARENWMLLGRAFVHFSVDLSETRPLLCIAHDALDDEASLLYSSTALDMHGKYFPAIVSSVSTYLERYRDDHKLPDLCERARQLLKFQLHQPQ